MSSGCQSGSNSNMNHIIRRATIYDFVILGKIHYESWQSAYKGIVPDTKLQKMSPEKSEKIFLNQIEKGLGETVIIYKESQAAGFITIGKCRDEDKDNKSGEIWGIYLLPSFWRQSIGTELINWGINELRNKGYSSVYLWVLEENLNACRFYERLGFVHDGKTKEINLDKPLIECRYVKMI